MIPASRSLLFVLFAATFAVGIQDKKPAERTPIPDAAKQKEAEKAVRELFKADYAKKLPAERQALAQLLLRHAKESKDDSAAQWVLFREAQETAAQCGDFELAAEAVDGAAAIFDLPLLETKILILGNAAKTARTPEELGKATDQLLKVVDAALATDDYDSADKALAAAQATAKRANLPAVTLKVGLRTRTTAEIKARFEKVKKSLDILAKDPDNGPANLDVGLFLTFTKRNWDEGLPLLAKGSDPALKAAATKDLVKPLDADKMVDAGDAWWDAAEKEKNEPLKRRITLRAVSFYEQALPALSGLMKTKVDLRLDTCKKKELTQGLETVFGEKSPNPNLVPCDADDGHFEETSIGGKSCVRLLNATIEKSDGTRYLYVHVVQKWQPQWKPVELEMEYYDEGNGSVDVHYDAVSGVYKNGLKSFTLGGTRSWKTFTFTLPEPLFSGRLKTGSDLRIHVFPGSAMAVHRMVLRLVQK